MRQKNDRLVVDTNLLISFLLSKNNPKFDRLLDSKTAVLLFSEELLQEFMEVVARPKFKKYFSEEDLSALLQAIESVSHFIVVSRKVQLCRDSKDDFLLSLAVEGKATHLLTGDKDLLTIKEIEGTRICTISDYLTQRS